MHRTRIKICGITRPADAVAAIEAGADAIGMILYANAPRTISLDLAQEIIRAVPEHVAVVGVFVNAEVSVIRIIADRLGLRCVQLHGDESPDTVNALREFRITKAIHPRNGALAAELSRWSAAIPTLRGVLIESASGAHAGGNGIESDWDAIARLPRDSGLLAKVDLIAAGGLRAENVARVIARIDPWAVDVSSGVEESIGNKSTNKMRDFCAAVRAADSERNTD